MIAGESTQVIERMPAMRTIPLPPLNACEARDIVGAICRRYHRMFEPKVVEALAARIAEPGPAQGNALWLVLAVEALNLLDSDDFARAWEDYADLPKAKRTAALMLAMIDAMPADIQGLYGQSFDRTAKLFGERTVWAVLGAIAVSRGGWRESDFRGFLPKLAGEPWNELRFAQLRRSFRGQMRARGTPAQWDFAHGQMREAFRAWAANRKLDDDRAINTAIADHLLAAPEDDQLRVNETMFHLIEAEDGVRRAVRYYGRPSLDKASKDGATQVLTDLIMADRSRLRATSLSKVFLLLDELTRLYDLGEPLATQTALNVARSLHFGLAPSISNRVELESQGALLIRLRDVLEQRAIGSSAGSSWQSDLTLAQDRIGDVLVAQGKLSEALREYHGALIIRERLVEVDPTNADWQGRLSWSHIHVGDILFAQGKLTEALKSFREGLAIKDRLARADPANPGWQRDLSAAQDRIGDALVAQGYLRDALKAYREGLKLVECIARAAAHNVDWQRDLSLSRMRIGDVLVAQGKLSEALREHHGALTIRERLVEIDPTNTDWQSRLSVSLVSIGDVLVAQGKTAEALISFREGLAIKDRLARADPANLGWQRDLSAAQDRIGDALVAHGYLRDALEAYRKGLAVREQLVLIDPSNATWQTDLSVSRMKIGDVLVAQGKLSEAFREYHEALTIREHVVEVDPTNTGWQSRLSVSLVSIGDALVAQGKTAHIGKHWLSTNALLKSIGATWNHRPICPSHGRGSMSCLRRRAALDDDQVKWRGFSTSGHDPHLARIVEGSYSDRALGTPRRCLRRYRAESARARRDFLRRVDPAIGDAELGQEQSHLIDVAGVDVAVERQHRRFLPETCTPQFGY